MTNKQDIKKIAELRLAREKLADKILAKNENTIAGCVALKKFKDSECVMKRLFVKEEFRGLKIGKALAQAVIESGRLANRSFLSSTVRVVLPYSRFSAAMTSAPRI